MSYRWTYEESFLFKGKHEDFDSIWFKTIGVTVVFTLISNIVAKPISLGIWALIRNYSRCCDRKCGCDKKITK